MRLFYTFLLSFCSLLPLSAQSVVKAIFAMQQLQHTDPLQAMDSATYVLTIDGDNTLAKNFMYKHWDKTMRDANEQLASLSDANDLSQARKRLTIYKHLDEIHMNLRSIRLPLYGPNNKWVWQPEVLYYSGSYDSERVRVYQLVLQKAEEVLRLQDISQARAYYEYALRELLVTKGERKSNLHTMVEQVNTRVEDLRSATDINQLIMAYNLLDLSLWLDESQVNHADEKLQLQQRISDAYLEQANAYEAQGDSLSAAESRLSAEDWRIVEADNGE